MNNITLILPVFNDWESLNILLKNIEIVLKKTNYKFNILLIDDSSTEKNIYQLNGNNFFKKITLLNLKQNIGSQRAIATAIKYIEKNYKKFDDKFIIMDSDGEDDPHKILELLKLIEKNDKVKIVTFNRTIRKESFIFSFLYEIHLFLTFLLTFNYTRFGNYSFIKFEIIKELSKKEELWLAYSATLNKHFKKKYEIKAQRKKRISGKSKMSYFNLIKHSLSIQAVNKKNLPYSYSIIFILFLFLIPITSIYAFFLILILLFTHFQLINHFYNKRDEKISFKNCLDNINFIRNI